MPVAVYVIGDIHGCFALLMQLENQIYADAKMISGEKLIVYLGDVVDRGDRSSEVIEHLLSRPPPRFQRICLRGNHEHLMNSFLQNPSRDAPWLEFGGRQTLESYGVDLIEKARPRDLRMKITALIPDAHLSFLSDLPVSLELPDYYIAHAGINPDASLHDQTDRDLLWIREPFSSHNGPFEKVVVHGHTPQETATVTQHKISIDTGAYASGKLSAVRLQTGVGPKVFEVGHVL